VFAPVITHHPLPSQKKNKKRVKRLVFKTVAAECVCMEHVGDLKRKNIAKEGNINRTWGRR